MERKSHATLGSRELAAIPGKREELVRKRQERFGLTNRDALDGSWGSTKASPHETLRFQSNEITELIEQT